MLKPWPLTVTQCPRTWNEQYAENRLRTSVDVGPPKMRRRYTNDLLQVQIGWNFKTELYQELTDFYRVTLRSGTDHFNFPHPVTGNQHKFQFIAPPQIEMIQGKAFGIVCEWEEIP